ncbi:hypothetical protein PR048_017496 [Dryococelus australis]|uniref:Uncharacterized protein n=1 Tax=Dryococelus australis TaxID=614101 RepID=A0ABQ9H9N4_9NEOP|nr:hypothetical protein PR048_017496 [Dryococelus australis]
MSVMVCTDVQCLVFQSYSQVQEMHRLEQWLLYLDKGRLFTNNSGQKTVVSILLKQNLQKDLLPLACRRHILELILANVINEAIRCISFDSDIAIFKRFKHYWSKIEQSTYEISTSNATVMAALEDEKDIVTQSSVNQLQDTQVIDYRREFIELTNYLLRRHSSMRSTLHIS